MGTKSPRLFGKVPLGLGSWRVESVVDSQEPNSMFVFLFDDGSGECMWNGGMGTGKTDSLWVELDLLISRFAVDVFSYANCLQQSSIRVVSAPMIR